MDDIFDNQKTNPKLEKAKLYVDGDMTKALQMVEGKYNDLIALKITFICNDLRVSGLIIIFLNGVKNKLHSYYSVVIKSEPLPGNLAAKPWQEYLLQIFQSTYSNKGDLQLNGKIKHELDREFTPSLLGQLNEKIFSKDNASISLQFEKIISFALRSNEVSILFDIEKTSSLKVDEVVENIRLSIEKKAKEELEQKTESIISTQPMNFVSKKDQELMQIGNRILKCKFVLSPVKGKLVSQLNNFDIVKIRINDNTAWALQIAEKLGWYKDKKMLPGTARVHSVYKLEKGNLVYVEIAPNLLGKIEEEEEVRVYIENQIEEVENTNIVKKILLWLMIMILILAVIGVIVIITN